jgi:hypothetical protein
MADQQAQKKLFDVLDKGAFQPVLRASENDIPENKRDKLEHVKRATESERERFKNYETAERMYQMYRDDLSSGAAESVNRDLGDLDLPKLADCQQQVENTARELEIR